MPIDPGRYDIDELREMAEIDPEAAADRRVRQYGFNWIDRDAVRRFGVEEPTDAQREAACRLVGGSPEALGEKPYLRALPEEPDETIREWLGYLMDEAGFEGTVIVLRHYRDLGWFTEAVETVLRDHLLAVPRRGGDGTVALDAADHLISFSFVVRLQMAVDAE